MPHPPRRPPREKSTPDGTANPDCSRGDATQRGPGLPTTCSSHHEVPASRNRKRPACRAPFPRRPLSLGAAIAALGGRRQFLSRTCSPGADPQATSLPSFTGKLRWEQINKAPFPIMNHRLTDVIRSNPRPARPPPSLALRRRPRSTGASSLRTPKRKVMTLWRPYGRGGLWEGKTTCAPAGPCGFSAAIEGCL
jgi:hypothetical protein